MAEEGLTLDDRLRFAIANRRLIRLTYEGGGIRVGEPHDYGIHRGAIRPFTYEIRGESRTPLPGWRLLFVSKIGELVVLDETFGGRGDSYRHHLQWDEVFARVT